MSNDSGTLAFLKLPIEFKRLCLVYPPSIKEVCSNSKFASYSKLLTLSQEEIEDQFVEEKIDLANLLTPFEYLFNNAYHSNEFAQLAKDAFYFFLHEQVIFLYEQKQILIGEISKIDSMENLRLLKDEDYFDFQNCIRSAIGTKLIEPPDPNENPRVKAIKAKARYRDRVKAKKQRGLDFKSFLAAICCMGIGLNPLNIGDISYASASSLMSCYQGKEKYDLDIQSLLAGADNKKIHPKYWIKNLEE